MSKLPDEVEKRDLESIKAEPAPRYAEFIGNRNPDKPISNHIRTDGQNLFDR